MYNTASENNFDQSRNIDQSTTYNFVDQDNSVVQYVNDSDTKLIENNDITLAISETRIIEADNSSNVEINNNFNQVEVDNSENNYVDASQISVINIDRPTFNTDMSQDITMTFQAPERAGGNIVTGNA